MRKLIATIFGMGCVLFGPLLGAGELYTLRVEVDEAEEIILAEEFTARVCLDFADGEPLAGYQFTVCHDHHVQLGEDGVENGAAVEASEFLFHDIEFDEDDKFHPLSFQVAATFAVDGTLQPDDDLELYVVRYFATVLGESGLEFCTGEDELPNVVVLEDLTEIEKDGDLGLVGASFEVTTTLPFYHYSFSEESGAPGRPVTVTTLFGNEHLDEIAGYTFAICHDTELVSLEIGGVENGSTVVDHAYLFHSVSYVTDGDDLVIGFTVAAVLGIGVTLDSEPDHELYQVTYDIDDEARIGAQAALEWCELGDPPITAGMVTDDLTEILPRTFPFLLEDGCIEVVESTDPFFVRGDCNDDGRLDIADGSSCSATCSGTGPSPAASWPAMLATMTGCTAPMRSTCSTTASWKGRNP